MSQEVKIIFKVTKKLEESLKEINSVLAKYVSKVEGSKVSHPSKSGEEIKKKFSEGIEIINEEEEGSNKSQKQNSNTAPERPKKPLTPFFRFSNQHRQAIKQKVSGKSTTEIGEMLGQLWNSLTEDEKKPYVARYEDEKEQYDQKMKKFFLLHPQQKSKPRKQKKKEKKTEKGIK